MMNLSGVWWLRTLWSVEEALPRQPMTRTRTVTCWLLSRLAPPVLRTHVPTLSAAWASGMVRRLRSRLDRRGGSSGAPGAVESVEVRRDALDREAEEAREDRRVQLDQGGRLLRGGRLEEGNAGPAAVGRPSEQ